MTRKSLRTKGVNKKRIKTPGGNNVIHYTRNQTPKQKICGQCGSLIHGIPRLIPSKMKNLAKSKKTVSRPYANLCSKCMRLKIKENVKKIISGLSKKQGENK